MSELVIEWIKNTCQSRLFSIKTIICFLEYLFKYISKISKNTSKKSFFNKGDFFVVYD